jgi:hypothetical protein
MALGLVGIGVHNAGPAIGVRILVLRLVRVGISAAGAAERETLASR